MNVLAKMLTSVVQSSAKSLLSSGIKKSAKDMFNKYTQKSDLDIEKEIVNTIGYSTQHYKLDKNRNVVYKASPVFFYEWLVKNPDLAGRIVKDEENGQVYYDGELINNQVKVELLDSFVKATKIQSAALASHFDGAMKLFDVSDFNSIKFKKHFAGWDVNSPSVIDGWMRNCFGSALTTDEQYASFLFKKWAIGTAKRAIHPGSSLDGCLVLTGERGVGKTQFFRQLLPEPFNNRTGEIYCDIKSGQKFVESIIGKTIACFDELSVLEFPQTNEIFKQLLSSQFIDVRMVWARTPRRYLLRQSFAGTTNKQKFISEKPMSRRLWTIELNNTSRLNFDYLNANKTALWKEAVYLAEHNGSCIMSPEEQRLVESNNEKYEVIV